MSARSWMAAVLSALVLTAVMIDSASRPDADPLAVGAASRSGISTDAPALPLAAQPSAPTPPAPPQPLPIGAPLGQPNQPPAAAPSPSEPTTPWMRTARETGLWSSWDEAAQEFVKIPPGVVLRALDRQATRTFVHFGGDNERRQAGEVWVETTDLEPAAWPRWVRAHRPATLRRDPAGDAQAVLLAQGSYIETVGEASGRWARAFYLGDGRTTDPLEGWVDAADFAVPSMAQDKLAALAINRETLAQTPPEIWLRVPYRSQRDGSAYAEANCGPTAVVMILDAFGRSAPPAEVRAAALRLQGTPGCDSCGTFIQDLAAVAQARGVPTHGLRGANDTLRRWTLDDVRAQLRSGRVVIPQVMYRQLPNRETSAYWGDHYIVVTGMLGDRFVYNDPIDGDGTGYGRLIPAEQLKRAMAESDFPNAAFAAGR